MTPIQRKLARHALGLPNERGVSYRKHFVTGAGSDDWAHWNDLVRSGHARARRNMQVFGGMDGFVLTRAGALSALDPGESLCAEDFPNDAA